MPQRISDDVRLAIAAALAAGIAQQVIAKQYKVARSTVALIKAQGKSVGNPEFNPLSSDWRSRHKAKAIAAVDRLDEIDDPAKAVEKGVTVLKGLGEYDSDGGATKVQVWLSSPGVQAIAARYEAIDVKPVATISDATNPEV